MRRAEMDDGLRPGLTTDERARDEEPGGRTGSCIGLMRLIDAHRNRFGVEPICRARQFAPTGLSAGHPRLAERDEELKPEILRDPQEAASYT